MPIILYLETNFILAMAKGQNGLADNIWQKPAEHLTIAIPSICLMESLVAWENEQKRSQSFRQAMKIEINEAKRNVRSEEARSLVSLLQESFISYENLLAEFDNRFEDVLETLKKSSGVN
jgi:rRNA-processing protein FCF1